MKKRIRTIMSIIAIVLSLCFVFTACGSNPSSGNSGESATDSGASGGENVTITFSCGESLAMDEWTTTRLSATASDKSSVTLTAADSSMLYIRGSSVTALKAGSTTITATAGKKKDVTATLKVTINAKAENRPVLSITGESELAVGQTLKFGASLSGVDASDYVVSYETENANVATVDAEGKVTALKAGKTKLKAKTTYRSVEFTAEKAIDVANEIKVIFEQGATETKLSVSAIKADLGEEYTLEINGKNYVADGDGKITLNRSDFDLSAGNSFEGKITEGENVFEFRLVVYTMEEPGVYQDGVALTPDENGAFTVDKTKPADENGLRWVTFDDADAMLDMGYELLKIKVKFNKFCDMSAGIIDSTIAAYNYNFGYRYLEYTDDPAAGEDVWFFWDNNYQGKGYGGAMKPAHHAPYGYGYLKILDAEGNLLLDYYQKQVEDGSGVHGNWSDYIAPLAEGTEYIFLLDISKTHDVSFSGLDDAVITGIEWCKKEETVVSFGQADLSVDEWTEADVVATTNDGSAIVYTVSDSEVLYLEGHKIVGLKAGTAKVIATANGKTAELTVTVNENAANRPVAELGNVTLEEAETANLSFGLKSGETVIGEDKYELNITVSDPTIANVSGKVVAALKAGETDITATFNYCGKEFAATAKITVSKAEEPVDPSVAKLYQNGEELVADENGHFAVNPENSNTDITFDSYAAKSALGMRRIRFTVKFKSFGAIDGTYEFGYTYKYGDNYVFVKFDNDYGGKMYAGGFLNGAGDPHYYGYVRMYDNTEAKYFEYYDFYGWSSSGYGYVDGLAVDTEYTFDIDIEKTGDITLYGFENAVFTKIEWVDYTKTEISFNRASVETDEWTWFDFSATTDDLSTLTFTSDDESILFVKGNKAIGIKAGTTNIVAKNSAGKTVLLPVTVVENLEKQPVMTATADKAELEVLESAQVAVALKVGETVVSSEDYEVTASVSSDNATYKDGKIIGSAEGTAKVTIIVDYCGKIFTAEIDITVTAAADPSKGRLFQSGKEIVADENGNYKVDTTVDGDANGLHWLTVDSAKTSTYTYLRFNVTFDSFPIYKTITNAAYDYNFGYNYTGCTAFWDNAYAGGGFGGALDAGGSAQNVLYYWNVYTAADNAKVLNLMGASSWSPYYTMQTGVEYIFEFNVKAMGDSFTLAGFETATIKNIVWAENLLG